MEIAKIAKPNHFECKKCNYITHNKYDFKKHCQTIKHTQEIIVDDFSINMENSKKYICSNCNKSYKDNSGLWKHKKLCKEIAQETNQDLISNTNVQNLSSQITPELILSVLEQNKELTNLVVEQNKTIMELAKNGQGNTISNNNINSNNKTFNLQFFLNETCKDAMNITDFVDSIKLQLSDLMELGELGYVEGISKIIVKNLNNLDETERPIHCTDKKRETFYIKDQDKWEKEDEEKKKIKDTIKTIANKNIRLLPQFREKFPDYNNSSSKTSDKYEKIVIEAMVSDIEKDEKIIKNISKVTGISKNN